MVILVYITAPNENEAEYLATMLIKQKVAACVNIIPKVQSVYLWGNSIHKDNEVILLVKTIESHFNKIKEIVCSIHSYDTPCIIVLPIILGENKFLTWVEDTVKEEH